MRSEDIKALAELYATWATDKLTDAVQNHRSDYAAEALTLMSEELNRRGITTVIPANGGPSPTSESCDPDLPFIFSTLAVLPIIIGLLSFCLMWVVAPFCEATETISMSLLTIFIYALFATSTWLPIPFLLIALGIHIIAFKYMHRTRLKIIALYGNIFLTTAYTCYWVWWHITDQQLPFI